MVKILLKKISKEAIVNCLKAS